MLDQERSTTQNTNYQSTTASEMVVMISDISDREKIQNA